jgi:hypothetical protein
LEFEGKCRYRKHKEQAHASLLSAMKLETHKEGQDDLTVSLWASA